MINNLPILLKGLLMTVQISAVGLGIGFILGSLLGTVQCKKFRPWGMRHIVGVYISIIRGTPLFVQILIVYFGLGLNLSPIQAGILALSINCAAYIAEIVRSGIDAIPQGQWEAAHALGYNNYQTMRYLIFPQALKKIMPPLTNEAATLIKETSVLMILGVPELTKVSKDLVARELKPMEIYIMAACLYFIVTQTVAWLTKFWEGEKCLQSKI